MIFNKIAKSRSWKLREPLLIDFFQKTKRNNELQGIFFLNSQSY